jgi:hypothetical protein
MLNSKVLYLLLPPCVPRRKILLIQLRNMRPRRGILGNRRNMPKFIWLISYKTKKPNLLFVHNPTLYNLPALTVIWHLLNLKFLILH